MLDPQYAYLISQAIPFLQDQDSRLVQEFNRRAFHAHFPAGREIFAEGDRVEGIALIISGVVRVYKISDSGREITLYRFGEGESCVITANAIINVGDFPAIAVVEQEAEAVMIPADAFLDWIDRYEEWRHFIFSLNAQRLISVMEIVDQVAFQRMDRRIAAFLLERADIENPIPVTHQEIANDLGSSREVVSRLLEDFSARGMVRLSRGEVEVVDRMQLRAQMNL